MNLNVRQWTLSKQFESNFYTTYKDTVHLVKGLSERLESLENKVASSLSTSSKLSKQFGSFNKEISHDVEENFGKFSKQLGTVEKAIHDMDSFSEEMRHDVDENFGNFSEQLNTVEKEVNKNTTACGSFDKKLNER